MNEDAREKVAKKLYIIMIVTLISGLVITLVSGIAIHCLNENIWAFVVLGLGFWLGLIILSGVLIYTLGKIWMEE